MKPDNGVYSQSVSGVDLLRGPVCVYKALKSPLPSFSSPDPQEKHQQLTSSALQTTPKKTTKQTSQRNTAAAATAHNTPSPAPFPAPPGLPGAIAQSTGLDIGIGMGVARGVRLGGGGGGGGACWGGVRMDVCVVTNGGWGEGREYGE
ncbi:hypothetical protein V494_04594 [Pseudogymnoascus sp. VKM F-4513 (FW-928)]|nr:hypothetical protein V494_04594 [Pseudogymnoascus sp. VKM F-4513 (FW-928)]